MNRVSCRAQQAFRRVYETSVMIRWIIAVLFVLAVAFGVAVLGDARPLGGSWLDAAFVSAALGFLTVFVSHAGRFIPRLIEVHADRRFPESQERSAARERS